MDNMAARFLAQINVSNDAELKNKEEAVDPKTLNKK